PAPDLLLPHGGQGGHPAARRRMDGRARAAHALPEAAGPVDQELHPRGTAHGGDVAAAALLVAEPGRAGDVARVHLGATGRAHRPGARAALVGCRRRIPGLPVRRGVAALPALPAVRARCPAGGPDADVPGGAAVRADEPDAADPAPAVRAGHAAQRLMGHTVGGRGVRGSACTGGTMSIPNPAPWGRYAEPGERCTCGRPAVVVWKTERFGEVGDCGIRDGG